MFNGSVSILSYYMFIKKCVGFLYISLRMFINRYDDDVINTHKDRNHKISFIPFFR